MASYGEESYNLASHFEAENTGGWLDGFLADEGALDRRALWRLGSWGVASVGCVIVAVLANQSSISLRRDQIAAADLARQSQLIQSVARESQSEARQLASAIDTLGSDRDRLYSRVTALEQGLDSVTGTIARQKAVTSVTAEPSPASPNPAPAPEVSPVATMAAPAVAKPAAEATSREALAREATTPEQGPATVSSVAAADPAKPASDATASVKPADAPAVISAAPLPPPKPGVAALTPPDGKPAAGSRAKEPKPDNMAALSPVDQDMSAAPPRPSVLRTEFGIDVGSANSIAGLRALWRGLVKSNAALASLRPVIAVREVRTGLGMQLRLVAGPFGDAAAAAKICAELVESQRSCETTIFDGQRLAMNADEPAAAARPAEHRRGSRHRSETAKRVPDEQPATKPAPSTLSRLLGSR